MAAWNGCHPHKKKQFSFHEARNRKMGASRSPFYLHLSLEFTHDNIKFSEGEESVWFISHPPITS